MIDNVNYIYEDDWASIRLADSFVRDNKAGTGNGEACLYLGSIKDPNLVKFYEHPDFSLKCILFRDEMIDYMDAVRDEYIHHRFPYRDEVSVKTWTSKVEELKKLPEEIFFILTRKRQFDKHGRVYAQELEYKRSCKLNYYESPRPYAYDLIRRLAIPEVSYLLFTKEEDADGLHLLTKLFYDPNKD